MHKANNYIVTILETLNWNYYTINGIKRIPFLILFLNFIEAILFSLLTVKKEWSQNYVAIGTNTPLLHELFPVCNNMQDEWFEEVTLKLW